MTILPRLLPRLLPVLAGALLSWGAAAQPAPLPAFAPLSATAKVLVGLVGANSDAALFIALERGYFAEYGLEIELKRFANSGQMIAPLGSNQLDVGGGGVAPGLWNAESRGIDLKAVADKGSIRKGFSYHAWVVKPGSPIKGCADLKGKTLSNLAQVNGVLNGFEGFMKTCGLSLRDMTVRAMGYAEVPAALASGAIDVAQLGEPLLTIARKQGLVELFRKQSDVRAEEQPAFLLAAPGFRAKTDLARRFFVAYARAIADYNSAYAARPLPDWFLDTMVKHSSLKDRALYEEVEPAGLYPFGAMNLTSMREDFDWFRARGSITSATVRFEDAVDTSFTEFARAYLAQHPHKTP